MRHQGCLLQKDLFSAQVCSSFDSIVLQDLLFAGHFLKYLSLFVILFTYSPFYCLFPLWCACFCISAIVHSAVVWNHSDPQKFDKKRPLSKVSADTKAPTANIIMGRFDGDSPRAKRRKIDSGHSHSLPDRTVPITSHKQLRDLLVFHQNHIEAKQGKSTTFILVYFI